MQTQLELPDDPVSAPLTEQERTDLLVCEQTIDRGFQSFVEVGMALARIRQDRLYRQDYDDFDHYCRQRWGISRIHAHRQIDAAKVCQMLPVGNRPANEAQVRPLTKIRTRKGDLDKKAIVRAWQSVLDRVPVDGSGRMIITAKVVEEAVQPTLRRRALLRAGTVSGNDSTAADIQDASPVEALIDKKIADAGVATAGPTKENISPDQFIELHGLAVWLKQLTSVPSIEQSPMHIRQCAERICQIVLE